MRGQAWPATAPRISATGASRWISATSPTARRSCPSSPRPEQRPRNRRPARRPGRSIPPTARRSGTRAVSVEANPGTHGTQVRQGRQDVRLERLHQEQSDLVSEENTSPTAAKRLSFPVNREGPSIIGLVLDAVDARRTDVG